ncbi:MAG: DNA polymerase III subunit delta' [Roseateles sp.]
MKALLPWLEAPLRDALQRSHSHALLVQGPAGVGQLELAMLLARSWLCESPAAVHQRQPGCGECASCRLFAAGTHPDFQLLLPEALDAACREALGLPAEEAVEHKTGKAKPSREIKVDAVRQLLGFAQATSARGRAKVVVIFPAEALNAVAANALLKTLEEPSGVLRFALATHDPAGLLPTIRSRCQSLSLPLPPADAAEAWLAGEGVEPALLKAAGGRPQLAREWHEAGLRAQAWSSLPKRVARGEAAALADWAPPRAIDALQRLCHDLLRRSHGQPGQYFDTAALPACSRVQPLLAWEQQLRRAARHAEHPLNAGLLIESLVTAGQAALTQAR